MTKAEISTIERFIRIAKSHDTVTMNPDTIGAVVRMIYEIWKAKNAATEQEPRTGHWVNTADVCMSDNIVCSECGYDSIANYKFCPNCGAKMIEPREKYCDRNICMSNEYNNIGCDECEVTKSREPQGSENK